MVVVDWYPNKDGYIEDGHVIAFCYAEDTTMAAGSWVTFGTSRANYIAVKITVAAADGVGMCLRAPVAVGDIVPVAFCGVVKTALHSTVVIGDLLSSGITTKTAVVEIHGAYTSEKNLHNGLGGNYTAKILGVALQGGLPADEILVLLGKLC
jgi:hypothetical protein